ncbi:MAG: hypothetical protein ACK4VI_06770 [Alphaproteobacteria bacterium]
MSHKLEKYPEFKAICDEFDRAVDRILADTIHKLKTQVPLAAKKALGQPDSARISLDRE